MMEARIKASIFTYYCSIPSFFEIHFFLQTMKYEEFKKVIEKAASERDCRVVEIGFNDDDNVFDVTIDKDEEPVGMDDCEYVHRAVLAAFDRNVEDYALTVGSVGIDAAEADDILKESETLRFTLSESNN